jgi:hypothetical protein
LKRVTPTERAIGVTMYVRPSVGRSRKPSWLSISIPSLAYTDRNEVAKGRRTRCTSGARSLQRQIPANCDAQIVHGGSSMVRINDRSAVIVALHTRPTIRQRGI